MRCGTQAGGCYADKWVALFDELGQFSLIFADAPGGKWEGLDRTIAALEPGGLLVVDDMRWPTVEIVPTVSRYACHVNSMSSAVIGEPSSHTAFGSISNVTENGLLSFLPLPSS